MVETTATTDAELVERLNCRATMTVLPPEHADLDGLLQEAASRIEKLSARLARRLYQADENCVVRLMQCENCTATEARALAAERQRDDLKAALEHYTCPADCRDECSGDHTEKFCGFVAREALSRLSSETVSKEHPTLVGEGAPPYACVACEGSPKAPNIPCAVCGLPALSERDLEERLRAYAAKWDEPTSSGAPVLEAADRIAALSEKVRILEGVKEIKVGLFSARQKIEARALAAERQLAEAMEENADLKVSVVAFCAPWAAQYARMLDLPEGQLAAEHYDLLERCGARMTAFTRAPKGESHG